MPASASILDAIGNTPLIELKRLASKGGARVVAKLESANPTGSMKDRLARTLIERAAERGQERRTIARRANERCRLGFADYQR